MGRNKGQLVFIDESGDSGFSVSRGSSKVFVIVCVVFEDELEAEKTAVAIKELKRKLSFSEKSEFKFNGSRKKVRLEFLKVVRQFDFKIRAMVIKKDRVRSPQLKNSKNSFYSYFVKTLLANARGSIIGARIRIDGSGDRIFRRNFQTYLRRELNTKDKGIVKNISLVNSKGNVLIQMADMIAGTIRRYEEGEKKDATECWDVIANKVEDCWDFK